MIVFNRIVLLRLPLIACLTVSLLAGCQNIGSVTVPRDRMDYATAIAIAVSVTAFSPLVAVPARCRCSRWSS